MTFPLLNARSRVSAGKAPDPARAGGNGHSAAFAGALLPSFRADVRSRCGIADGRRKPPNPEPGLFMRHDREHRQ